MNKKKKKSSVLTFAAEKMTNEQKFIQTDVQFMRLFCKQYIIITSKHTLHVSVNSAQKIMRIQHRKIIS